MPALQGLFLCEQKMGSAHKTNEQRDPFFKNQFLPRIVSQLVQANNLNEHILNCFTGYLQYDDVRFYTLSNLKQFITKHIHQQVPH